MKKVLLTGASGFIGFQCIKPLLQKDYEVIALSSKPQKFSFPFYQVDLLNQVAVKQIIEQHKPTHLLHLAWYAASPHYWDSPLNLDWLEASLHLLRCFYACGGKRAVVAGTCAEYEWGHPLCDEIGTPCRPATLYGAVKLSLSMIAEKLTQLENRSMAWARLFHLFGPREHPNRLVPMIIRSLLSKNKVPCSHGQQIRDYLYVQDAANALAALLESGIKGSVNIGSGQYVKIRDIIEKIAEKIGNKELIEWGSLPVNASDPMQLIPEIYRLKEEVKWTPAINLERGLEQTISWWKNEIHH